MKKTLLTVALLGACFLCFAVAARTDGAAAAEPEGSYKPVSSVHGLMNGQSLVFAEITRAVQDKSAKKRAEVIEALSEVLAELANVNTFNGEKDDYRGWAAQLRDTALELAREAEKKPGDDAKMTALVERLKSTCTACHDVYQ